MTLPALALFDQQAPGEGAPIAQAFSLTTYRDVAVSGTFTGVDPQGEPLTFRVTENPARGSVTLAQEGSARFTYTPYENKTGRTPSPTWRWTRRGTSPSRRRCQWRSANPAPG